MDRAESKYFEEMDGVLTGVTSIMHFLDAAQLVATHSSRPSVNVRTILLRAFALLTLLVTLAGPGRVVAYDVCSDSGRCTHEEMTGYGITVYNSIFPENAFDTDSASAIKFGAGHEDQVDHGYGYGGDFVTVTHFWNADEPNWDKPSGIPFINGDEPNSWQKVRQYWMRALGESATCITGSNPCSPTAYGAHHYLGHVAHHLGDNTIPTHVHVDAHDPFSGDDAYEDWMSQGAETDLGTQESAPDQPPGSNLNGELPGLSNATYISKTGGLDPLQAVGRYFAIPPGANLGPVETPLDRLYWLLYTTNQIADFFPSDSKEGDSVDREGWVVAELANMSGITSPRVSSDLDNNDCHESAFGGCGSGTVGDYDNNFYDNDLGVIRDHSYLRGIRAIAGLMRLYEDTVKTEPVIAVDITGMSILNGDCDDFTFLPACEAYAQVTIGSLTGRNEGDTSEVGDGDSISTPGWRWGNTVADAAFTDVDGREKIIVQISIRDDDPDVEGLQSDDTIDVVAGSPGYLSFKVDVEKCILGQPNAFENHIGFSPISGRCGDSLTSSEGRDEYVGTAGGSVTLVVDIASPPVFTRVSAGQVFTIEYGEEFKVQGGSKIDNNGTIINNGTLIVRESGVVNNEGLIVNRENIRLYDGTINNNGVIDNSQGNHISNNGTIVNSGEIFAPFDRYYGNQPSINLPSNNYYIGKVSDSFGCRVLGGTWVVSTDTTVPITYTCVTQNSWLKADKSLVIDEGVTLAVNGTMNNEGSIVNRGTIDNTIGTVNQCGSIDGNQPTAPAQVDKSCIVSPEAQQCNDYGGTWNLNVANRCDLGTEGGDASSCTSGGVPVALDDTLTIRNGITWYVPCELENFGAINIEQNGELHITGKIFNYLDDTTGFGLDAVINNDGLISLEDQASSGIGGIIRNDGLIYNSGTITTDSNTSHIAGSGTTENRCGSIFKVDRGLSVDQTIYDDTCHVPDTDGDGTNNELDAFPYDALEVKDSDGDGVGDNTDRFPNDRLESVDNDGDGVGDNADAFPNDSQETVDSDFDGVGDNSDTFPADARLTSIESDNQWALTSSYLDEPVSVSDPLPEGVILQHGLVNFELSGDTIGAEATITITYSEPFNPENTVWWKYGPTPANNKPHWYVFEGATFSGNTVTLTITDGGIGDDDLAANGSISDPGGPGNPEPVEDPGSGSSSSFGAVSLLTLFIAVLFSTNRRKLAFG